MKKYLLSIIGIWSMVLAQNPTNYLMGATGVINDAKFTEDVLETQYPGFKEAVANSFVKSHQFSNKGGQVHNVNVVVHVVWNQPEENIHDSIIYRQIDILNEDFNRLNADTVNLRSIFTPIAGNPHIHFELDSIVRVQTTETFGLSFAGLPDEVKQTSQGGSDAWDTEHLMNIWVCQLQNNFGALFGYAYPPAGLSNWPADSDAPSPELDGVVIDFRAFSDNNPNLYPDPNGGGGNVAFSGRTTVHEVGHYLGLRHIWGDGGGFFGGESCGEDDGIADTPNQGYQSEFDCSSTNNTCIDSIGGQPDPNDMPDLIENHMDYSAEACKNMFTIEQAMHMRGVLENERVGLIGGVASIDENDLEFKIFPNPAKGWITLDTESRDGEFMILDSFGRVVKKGVLRGLTRVDCTSMATGLYVVKLISVRHQTSKILVLE